MADKKKTFSDYKKKKPETSAPAARSSLASVMRPTVDKCHVCRSTYRDQIERFIVYGMTQAEVVRHMALIGEKISKDSMSNHVRSHMTLGDAAVRRMVEMQAEKNFENIEEVAGSLLTNRAMLETMRHKAMQAIVDNEVQIEPQVALSIIQMLDKDDAKLHQHQVDEMVMEINALTAAMKQIVPEPMWEKVVEQFQINLDAARTQRKQITGG